MICLRSRPSTVVFLSNPWFVVNTDQEDLDGFMVVLTEKGRMDLVADLNRVVSICCKRCARDVKLISGGSVDPAPPRRTTLHEASGADLSISEVVGVAKRPRLRGAVPSSVSCQFPRCASITTVALDNA